MKPTGFTPTNFQLKPPYLSFALVLIGIGLTVLGVVLYFLSSPEMNLRLLPPVTLYLGLVLFLSTNAYLWNRHRKKEEAKKNDEKRFTKWAAETYNLTLDHHQIEQLLYYGSSVVDGKKFVLHYELVNDEPIGYLYSTAQWQEIVATEILQVADVEGHPKTSGIPLPYLDETEDDLELDDEELVKESEAALLAEAEDFPLPPEVEKQD